MAEWKATSFVLTWDRYVVGGQPWALPAARDLLSAESAVTAIELLRAIWRVADKEVSAGDPIAVHEAMAAVPAGSAAKANLLAARSMGWSRLSSTSG